MLLCQIFYVLLCMTSVLTLATTKNKKTITSTVVPHLDGQPLNNSGVVEKMNSTSGNLKIVLNLNSSFASGPIHTEGGVLTASSASSMPLVNHNSLTSSETLSSAKVSLEKARVMLPGKGTPEVSKIIPRKGVSTLIENGSNETHLSAEYRQSNLTSSTVQPLVEVISNLKNSTAEKTEDWSVNISSNNSSSTETPQKFSTQKVSTQKAKKHKLKPLVTKGGSEEYKPIPATPTKNPPLGMPRKIDIIVPVMTTILVLPLLGVATFILYRRGRDCWDKRHYRRMDFLIDGMYNE